MKRKVRYLLSFGPAGVKSILTTSTFKQSGITFTGTMLNGALGAVFYILAARTLGPADFGVLSVAIGVATLVATIADFGTDTGLVRFVSEYIKKDREKANRFLKLSFTIKLVAGVSITLLGILISSLLSNLFFKTSEYALVFRYSFTIIISSLFFGFVVNFLKALQKFFVWSVVMVSMNGIRLLATLAFFLLGIFTLSNAALIYSFTLLVGAIAGFLIFVPKDFLKVKGFKTVGREFVSYNKWIAGFTLVAAVSSKMDTFMSAKLLSAAEVGLYSAALQLVYIVPQIVGALGTVVAPKMAEMESGAFVRYLKKIQLMVLGIAGLGLLSIPVISFLVPLVYGHEYIASIPLFIILLFAMLVFLISVPVHNAILYHYSYPKLFFWLSIGNFCIITFGGFALISILGVAGAAISVLLGTIFNFVIPAIWVYKKIRS